MTLELEDFCVRFVDSEQHKSIVSLVAFYAGSKMEHFSSNQLFDFSDKISDVLYQEFFAVTDLLQATSTNEQRELFWNSIEITETLKQTTDDTDCDINFAFEFDVLFPEDLSDEKKISLARSFVLEGFIARGIAADLFCHHGLNNPKKPRSHFHVLVPLKMLHQVKGCYVPVHWHFDGFIKEFYDLWKSLVDR